VLGLLPDWPVGYAVGRVLQEVTTAFARHQLTFVVHPDSRSTRPLTEIWKTITPVAVLAFDLLSRTDLQRVPACVGRQRGRPTHRAASAHTSGGVCDGVKVCAGTGSRQEPVRPPP
jgi:hypothetical protein